jgi:hypothetical protein
VLALMRHALTVALESGRAENTLRAYFNLAYLAAGRDRRDESEALDDQGLELARRLGNRQWEQSFVSHSRANRFFMGQWDGIEPPLEELLEHEWDELAWALRLDFAGLLVPIHVARGRLDEAREILRHVPTERRAESQERASIAIGRATLAYGEGRYEETLELMAEAADPKGTVGADHPYFKQAIAGAVDAALAVDDLARIEPMFDRVRTLPPAQRQPFVVAQLARYDAHVAARGGDSEAAEARFRHSAAVQREADLPFWLAIVLLEHAQWLSAEGGVDQAEPLLAEAREIFAGLDAAPWLERLDALAPAAV